jgi:hypothetical protein
MAWVLIWICHYTVLFSEQFIIVKKISNKKILVSESDLEKIIIFL